MEKIEIKKVKARNLCGDDGGTGVNGDIGKMTLIVILVV